MSDNNIAPETLVQSALAPPEYVQEFLDDRVHRAREISDILGLVKETSGGGEHGYAIEAAYRLAQELAESLDGAYMERLARGDSLRSVLREARMCALGE